MRNKLCAAALVAAASSGAGLAQDTPLTDIGVAVVAGPDRDATGLVPAERAGLSVDMWRGGNSDRAIALLSQLKASPYPGAQDLAYRLILAEANPPERTDDALILARLDALMLRGALDRAQALIERSGPDRADLFRRWFEIALLTGSEDRACAVLDASPALTPDQASRIFCMARGGRWMAASITLASAYALGDMTEPDYTLLSRFLDPELFEGQPPLPRPRAPTALSFRVFEAIGEPLPTRDLPLAFTWADLRFVAGWKAQLEAGERLARTGAIDGNRLLGLYTERRAAASGGVWDRVNAVQKLDVTLTTGEVAPLSAALISADAMMSVARLEVALARMFAPRLARVALTGQADVIAARLRLLAGEVPDTVPLQASDVLRLAHALRSGGPTEGLTTTPLGTALADAFQGEVVPIQTGQGETILAALTLLLPGAEADLQDRIDALKLLRAVGQDQSARRIASDMLLLPDRPL